MNKKNSWILPRRDMWLYKAERFIAVDSRKLRRLPNIMAPGIPCFPQHICIHLYYLLRDEYPSGSNVAWKQGLPKTLRYCFPEYLSLSLGVKEVCLWTSGASGQLVHQLLNLLGKEYTSQRPHCPNSSAISFL